jgi:hypothetical protein
MSEKTPNYHEYLNEEDYYETNSVGAGRSDKWCAHCGGTIKKGTSHRVAKFYPEFASYPLHIKCEADFMESLRPEGYVDPEDEEGENNE